MANSRTTRAPSTRGHRRRCSLSTTLSSIHRNRPVEHVKGDYITVQKETDAGLIVSGAEVVATNSALTHYDFSQNMGKQITDRSIVGMFIAPMNTPGIKLICRPSYEFGAAATGAPRRFRLSMCPLRAPAASRYRPPDDPHDTAISAASA
jgi:hypothetical protein